jgi:hypothetical protein
VVGWETQSRSRNATIAVVEACENSRDGLGRLRTERCENPTVDEARKTRMIRLTFLEAKGSRREPVAKIRWPTFWENWDELRRLSILKISPGPQG